MGRGLSDLVNSLFVFLPVELAIAVLLAAALLILPGWIFAIRAKQIKGLIRKRVRASAEERDRLANEALALAAGKGNRLVVLARESLRMGQRELWKRAMDELQLLPAHVAEARELTASISRESQPLLHPVEVVMTVQRLLELHMTQAALDRIDEALERFPRDDGLLTAREQVLSSLQTSSEALDNTENLTTKTL
jgi:hypothetical protein